MKKIVTGVGFIGLFMSTAAMSFAAYFNTDPIARCETQITRTLRIGSENNDVFVLQQMLNRAGYLNAYPNGYFGYQTARAVKAFQADNDIMVTGSVGAATRDAVNERLCDQDLTANQYYNDTNFVYGFSSPSTYVNGQDPFVHVVTPNTTNPTVYATPQGSVTTITTPVTVVQSTLPTLSTNGVSGYIPSQFGYINQRPNYIPEPSGSLTVTSPVANSMYREGDTVTVTWSSSNLSVNAPYSILLENTSGGPSKTVGVTSGSPFSFVLTKEILDSVCGGSCTESQQTSFRVVIATPTTNYNGDVSMFRAAVAPITIKRLVTLNNKVTLSSSKTEVTSGEAFKLFVNFPSTSWDSTLAANYTIKIKPDYCGVSASISINGLPCDQPYTLPQTSVNGQYQQEVSAKIVNPLYQKQVVTFQVLIVNVLGQVVGVSETRVTVNSAPLGW